MTATVGAAVVAFEDVTKSYGAVRALRDVSFDITSGQIVALLGRNGAGKSTAVDLMLGLRLGQRRRVDRFLNPAGAIDRRMGRRVRQHCEHPGGGHGDSQGGAHILLVHGVHAPVLSSWVSRRGGRGHSQHVDDATRRNSSVVWAEPLLCHRYPDAIPLRTNLIEPTRDRAAAVS